MPFKPLFNPDWDKYASGSQRYITDKSQGTSKLTGQMLSDAAKKTFTNTGVYVPPQLALAQAQFESSFGRKGRNPTTNPFNIGEFDKGTKRKFANMNSGVQAYMDTMAKGYLGNGRTLNDLTNKFVNKAGNRYASDKLYESKIKKQIPVINKYFKGDG